MARRHFEYTKPVNVPATEAGSNTSLLGALVYTRAFDPGKLGLTPDGALNALKQGKVLAELGIIPEAIISGIDQRNTDGARFTVAGIKEITGQDIQCLASPAITYPYYVDAYQTAELMEKYGDGMVHRCLAGDLTEVWTETAEGLEKRIISAVGARYPWGTPILFEMNFEPMVLLYYWFVKGTQLSKIPLEDGWCPTYGCMIVMTNDGTPALCDANLEVIEDGSM
ncbi:hypothetical protein KKC06_02230 [Patescibacteria group bacterium]|nr:hypothetical protein [Patescibacteria group bacterium]